MTRLLAKELRLALHPTNIIFLALSLLLLIPNYPYLITFFYTSLGIFFLCQNGRENKDIYYSLLLPLRKRDIVQARVLLIVLIELAQVLIAIPAALIRNALPLGSNMVGIDANLAFFGFAFIMMGLFNLVFITRYYHDVNKIGGPFVISCVVMFLFIIIIETACHVIPYFRMVFDTPDPLYLAPKLAVLLAGSVIFLLLTLLAYRRSAASFERLDL